MTVAVVVACNEQGAVEPFAFERNVDAHRYAEGLRGKGQISAVMVYPAITVHDEVGASQLTFTVRGFSTADEVDEVDPTPTNRRVARNAVNVLIGILADHEREAHAGEPCLDERAGMVAFVAHAVGLHPQHLDRVGDALAIYEEHHEPGHRHG